MTIREMGTGHKSDYQQELKNYYIVAFFVACYPIYPYRVCPSCHQLLELLFTPLLLRLSSTKRPSRVGDKKFKQFLTTMQSKKCT